MMNIHKQRKMENSPSIQGVFPLKTSERRKNASTGTQDTYPMQHKNLAPTASPTTSQQPVPPCVSTDQPSSSSADHVSGSHPKYRDRPPMNLNMYLPLYRAALRGDWEEANFFLNLHPGAEYARITEVGETALHLAAGARHTKFVEELIEIMSPEDLALQNKDDNTALCFAAASGITRIAEVMVNKNKDLPRIRGSLGVTPLYMAALLGHRDMVWYLDSVTDDGHLTSDDHFGLVVATITADLFDFALHILWKYPHLAFHRQNGETALHLLARKPSAFASGSCLGIWERCIYQYEPSVTGLLGQVIKLLVPGTKAVYEKKLKHMQALELVTVLWLEVISQHASRKGDLLRSASETLFIATEFGIVEFVTVLVYEYPELIWMVDEQKGSLFHNAVMYRQEKIFSLIYKIGAHKDLITSYKDDKKHNMLHLAGKLAPSNLLNVVSGAALQMQRELLWFKEVEKIVHPIHKHMRDSNGKTPQMVFTEEHKDLLKEGENWMKNTASSYTLVATLITTVMFAAIFTVPGGNNNNNGTPTFLHAKAFVIFAISDAIALFSSVTSVLIFLSILTSRYAEEDFLKSLPQRLILGITALFLSIVTMLIAFSATLFIVLGHQWAWILIPLALITCLPVTVFAFLQFPLLFDTIHSTFGSGIFSHKSKYIIF